MMRLARHVIILCAMLGTATMMMPQDKYFPTAAFGDANRSQEWIALYSKYLRAFKEPPLFDHSQPGVSQSFRFLWLRSFHKPVLVRLDVQSYGTGVITVKVGGMPGVSGVGEAPATSRILTKQDVDSFLSQINSLDFWKLPAEQEPVAGPDGARWILEGAKGNQYHVVHRWTPKEGAVRTLCLYLAVNLGQLKLASNAIY